MLHLQWIQKTRVELSGFKIHLYMVYAVQYVSSVCWCGTLLLKTLYNNNFVFLFVLFFFVVEEILVCFDGSQPEILQGFYCGGGEFIGSLSNVSMLSSCFYLLVGLCLSSGFWPGWWDWPVNLLQCDRVPGTAQLWLPNTCMRLCLLMKFFFLLLMFVYSWFYNDIFEPSVAVTF